MRSDRSVTFLAESSAFEHFVQFYERSSGVRDAA